MATFEVMGQLVGTDAFFVIAGPCVLEDETLAMEAARFLQATCAELEIPYLFKSSYDKANRTSLASYRGPGLESGLAILDRIRRELRVPVLTDVHSPAEAVRAAQVVDVLQIPAFLARQTDLLVAAATTGRPVNVKKGQFLAPWDMAQVITKIESSGNHRLLITERGTTFGYNNLVVDMRAIPTLAQWHYPVVFDATHSVQLPGGQGTSSGGQRQFVATLARAAVAAGAHGVFIEAHPDPDRARCDGPNSLPLAAVPSLLKTLKAIYRTVQTERQGSA